MILSDLLGFWPLTSRKMNFFGVWSWPVKYPFLVEDVFLLICPCYFSIILSKLVLKTKYMCAETYKWQLLYRVKGWVFSMLPLLLTKKNGTSTLFPISSIYLPWICHFRKTLSWQFLATENISILRVYREPEQWQGCFSTSTAWS